MKTLQEIKDEIAEEIGKKNWSNMLHNHGSAGDSLVDLVAKRFAEEVAKETLRNVLKNAKIIKYDGGIEESEKQHYVGSVFLEVNKSSIMFKGNIPNI